MNLNAFMPVQKRMYHVLSDGNPHKPEELHACLDDLLGPLKNINYHITIMRKYLRTVGQDISHTKLNGKSTYCLVRIVAPSSRE